MLRDSALSHICPCVGDTATDLPRQASSSRCGRTAGRGVKRRSASGASSDRSHAPRATAQRRVLLARQRRLARAALLVAAPAVSRGPRLRIRGKGGTRHPEGAHGGDEPRRAGGDGDGDPQRDRQRGVTGSREAEENGQEGGEDMTLCPTSQNSH